MIALLALNTFAYALTREEVPIKRIEILDKGEDSTFVVEIPLAPDNYKITLSQEKNIQ